MISYEEAVMIMREAHVGQVDKNGEIYSLHPLRVSRRFKDLYEDEIMAISALFHDLFEDTSIKEEDLRKIGITEEIITIINLLTRNKDEKYFDYIKCIKDSKNSRAILVKIADLEDNLRPSITDNTSLKERYIKSLHLLVL